MKLIIDGQSDLLSIKGDTVPSDLLEQLEHSLGLAHQVPVAFELNNQAISQEDLEKKLSTGQISMTDTLKVDTVPVADYLQSLLTSIETELGGVDEKLVGIADGLLKAGGTEAFNQIVQWSSDTARLITNIIQLRQMFSIPLEDLQIDGKGFLETIKKINDALTQVNAAIEKNDRTTLADLLEFEMGPVLGSLRQIFPIFHQRISQVFGKNKDE